MNYKDIDQSVFESYLQLVLDKLASAYTKLETSVFSAVHELIIRPFAYLAAWVQTNFDTIKEQNSLTYYENSLATDTENVDRLAANYFLERKQGTKASGYVTVYLNKPLLQVPKNTLFTIGGYSFIVTESVIAVSSTYEKRTGITYVPVLPYDATTYVTFIPVEAQATGAIELNVDSEVTTSFKMPQLLDVVLTTPITGGTDTETDASLIARIKDTVGVTSVGTKSALKRKLQQLNSSILDIAVQGGEQTGLERARYNNLNLNIGNYVDCYIKTVQQPVEVYVTETQTYNEAQKEHTLALTDVAYSGLYKVQLVAVNDKISSAYTVNYGSDKAALSAQQNVTLNFSTAEAVKDLNVDLKITYMPGVYLTQSLLTASENQYIGLDVQVKAAIPLHVRLDCAIKSDSTLSTDDIFSLKQIICACVNSKNIGCCILNFSDIQKTVQTTISNVELRLPCAMTARMLLRDRTEGSFYSTSGILDISKLTGFNYWSPSCVFFSLIPENVHLTVL